MRREDRETIPHGYQAAFDKTLNQKGPHICRKRNRYPDRPKKTTTGYLAFRSPRDHQNDARSKNILVARHETRYREQGQALHRMPSIR